MDDNKRMSRKRERALEAKRLEEAIAIAEKRTLLRAEVFAAAGLEMSKFADAAAKFSMSTPPPSGPLSPFAGLNWTTEPEQPDPIKVRADEAMQAILDDISANTLNGDEAVMEAAGKWLTTVTNEITALLKRLEDKPDAPRE